MKRIPLKIFKFRLKLQLIIAAFLATCFLFATIVWLEIGPEGKIYYGPTVADIYISGADIIGKDKNWFAIDFGYKFQFSMILLYLFNCWMVGFYLKSEKFKAYLMNLNFFLVLLFPVWFYVYVGAVINNSDCADLRIHFKEGTGIYILLLVWNIVIMYANKTNKKSKTNGDIQFEHDKYSSSDV
jgi:hypothetical protein